MVAMVSAETEADRYFLIDSANDHYPAAGVGQGSETAGDSVVSDATRLVVTKVVVATSHASGGIVAIKNHAGTTLYSMTVLGLGLGLGEQPAVFPLMLEFGGGLRVNCTNASMRVVVHYRVLERDQG